jgi:hypothetical protein
MMLVYESRRLTSDSSVPGYWVAEDIILMSERATGATIRRLDGGGECGSRDRGCTHNGGRVIIEDMSERHGVLALSKCQKKAQNVRLLYFVLYPDSLYPL